MVYPFVHEVPFVTVATPGMDPHQSAVLGNVLSPSYVPEILFIPNSFKMSVWERFKNTVCLLASGFMWRHWTVVPLVQNEVCFFIYSLYSTLNNLCLLELCSFVGTARCNTPEYTLNGKSFIVQ